MPLRDTPTMFPKYAQDAPKVCPQHVPKVRPHDAAQLRPSNVNLNCQEIELELHPGGKRTLKSGVYRDCKSTLWESTLLGSGVYCIGPPILDLGTHSLDWEPTLWESTVWESRVLFL